MPLHSSHSTQLEQPGDRLLVPLRHFWDRWSRFVLGGLAGLVVLGIAGFYVLRTRQAAEDAAAAKLAEASLFYWQGDYQRSLAIARETAEQYGGTQSGHEAHRQMGDAAYWGGDFRTAAEEYRRYLATKPVGLLADAARRSLAYALESDHQYLDAAKEYEAVVGRFDRASSAEFLLAAARCLEAAGQQPAAMERLQRVLDEYGETDYANQARLMLAELQAAQNRSPKP